MSTPRLPSHRLSTCRRLSHRDGRRFLPLFLTLLLAIPLAQAESQQENQRQLHSLVNQIKKLKNLITGTQGERSKAAESLKDVERQIGSLASKLRNTEQAYQQQSERLDALQSQQQKLHQQQQTQKTLIAEQIRSSYTLGREKQLKMLLNQEDPSKLTRMISYYDYFNAARSEELKQYRKTLDSIQALLPEIKTQTEALASSKADLEHQRNALAKQKQQRAQIVSKLDQELSSQQGQLNKLDAQRKELEKVLEAIAQEVTDIPIPDTYRPFKEMRGKMPWPINGKRLNSFGAARAGSSVRWQGIQIAGKEGENVRAIHNGRVVYADWLRGAGLLLILDHGGDYLSLYAHNQSLLREEGDWVKAGEAVATVGNSGGQRQAGLYFEIRHRGKPTDPRRWCR